MVEKLERKIDDADVAAVVARRTGIPLSKMLTAEKDRLVNMEAFLSKKIVGQDKAIKAIANAVRKARAGLKMPNRPVGSFLFPRADRNGKNLSAQTAGGIPV